MSAALDYGKPINLAQAQRLAQKIRELAQSSGLRVVVVILDSAAQIVLVERMEQTNYGSFDFAWDKARTAINFKRPSQFFSEMVSQPGAGQRMLGNPHVCTLAGGMPILMDSELIGAIAVSGASSEQDQSLAEQALSWFAICHSVSEAIS